MLNWDHFEELQHNDSQAQRVPVEDAVRQEIRRLNEQDVRIYEEALELRTRRRRAGRPSSQ